MYPCTKCGTPLNGPVCPQCGQAHSAPGRPTFPHAATANGADARSGTEPAPPPPADPVHPSRSGGKGRSIAIAAVSLVVLLGLGFLAWSFSGDRGETTTSVTTPPVATVVPTTPTQGPASVEPSTPEPTRETSAITTDTSPSPVETSAPATTQAQEPPTPVVTEDVTPDVQGAAQARLEELRTESLPHVSLDGRWVAVLSTKKSGIEDKSQTAKNGSHIFYDDDILAFHEELAERFSGDVDVLLVKTSDFGKQRKNGDVFWRTIADGGFYDKDQVTNWCNRHFTGTVAEIQNSCLPKPLVPATNP